MNIATIMGLTGSLTASTNYPDAAGIIFNLSGNVYIDIHGGAADSDFKTNYARYPILNAGNGIKLSRVV